MDYLNIIGTIVSWVVGIVVVIIPMFVYSKDHKIAKEGLIMVILGIVLIGAPTIWNRVTISVGEVKFVLETLEQNNKALENEVIVLNEDKKGLIEEVDKLKEEIRAVQPSINPNALARINNTFSKIEEKNTKIDASSKMLMDKIDKSNRELADLKSRIKGKIEP